ncbi:MAG: dihydrofolate reductase family protein [Thermodesulfobacteriota bacterium]
MRKLVVLSFLTLDGVMQAPGGPEEDPTGNFAYGGWVFPYFDDFLGRVMDEQMGNPFDLLLGRRTYEIFAAYWPYVQSADPIATGINSAKKYVASRTLTRLDWGDSELLRGDVAAAVAELKEKDGPDIQVHGSGVLVQTLLQHDLVDELWLKIFPITLGRGKRLFATGAVAAGFELRACRTSPAGVIVASYSRAGGVRPGSFAPEEPSEAELARRRRLQEEEGERSQARWSRE